MDAFYSLVIWLFIVSHFCAYCLTIFLRWISLSHRPPQLRNLATGHCLVAQGRASQKGGAVVLRPCDVSDPEQVSHARRVRAR